MAGPIRIAILANGSQARREADTTGRAYSKMGSALGKASRVAAIAGAAVGAAAIVAGKAAVNLASDSQQSLGATETVYGKYAQTVIKRSEEAAAAIGLSANEYRELANVSGAMLKASQIPLEKVTDLTGKLNQRAADVAATFGGTTREAVESFNALLRGETDPVERYGVAIKQSDVNARLAAKGLDKLEGSAKKQAEAQARLDLLFKQTKDSAGQFGRESDTLAGQQQRLRAEIENLGSKAGTLLLPALTDLAAGARKKLLPVLESAVDWFEKNQDAIADTAGEIGGKLSSAVDTVVPLLESLTEAGQETGEAFIEVAKPVADVFVPALESAVSLAKMATDAYNALPGPVKEIAIQAGLAAIVLPRLSAAATSAGVAMRNGATYARVLGLELRDASSRAALAQTTMAKLGGAAKTAAGIGGMVALTSAAGASNKALGALGSTAGGALLGFSVGGPWGAAIGGGAGLLAGLWSATRRADGATASLGATAEAQKQKIDDLAGSFHGLSGAIDETTRKTVLKELSDRDMIGTLQMVGVSTRDAIDATLGNEGAQRRVAAAINQARDAAANVDPLLRAQGISGTKLAQAADAAAGGMQRLGFDMSEARLAAIENYRATAPLGQLYRGLPKKAITQIRAKGAPETIQDVRRLKRQFDLTPKQVRTLIRASGVPATRKDIENLAKRARDLGRQRPTVRVQANTKTADSAVDRVNRALRKVSTFIAKPVAQLDDKASKSANAARDRLQGLGRMNPRPVVSLTDRATPPINAIRDRLSQLRDKDITVTTYQRTVNLGGGGGGGGGGGATPRVAPRLAPGLVPYTDALDTLERAAGKRAESAGTRLIRRLLKGVDEGSQGASKAVERLNSYIERTIKSRIKDDKKAAARTKAILKGLADEQKALTKNGRAQDRNQRKLDSAIQKHKDLVDAAKQYAATIKDSIVGFGDVTELGRKDGSDKVALSVMLKQLEQRAASAERYAKLVEQLRKSGLNQTSIQDLLDKGPEAGLATAEAIAGGGAAAVAQINKLTADLATTGGKLGEQMKNAYHSAGINAAQGLVSGLEKSQKQLEKVAQRLANAMTKAVKKALGIKSPSRVFRSIGDQTVSGLTIGLNDPRVAQAGKVMAGRLRDGFGTPALDAYAASGGSSSARTVTVTLRAEEVDRLRRGKEIQMDLDFYQAHGGRARATGKVGG